MIGRIIISIRTIDGITIKRPTNNRRVFQLIFLFQDNTLVVFKQVITQNISQTLRIRQVGILTTILVIVSFKYSTLCRVKRRSFLKVVSPLEYICSKICILTNRVQINNCCTLNISNTFVDNGNTCNTTSILTIKVDSCSCNSTKTFTLNGDFWCGSVSRTSRDNSNRNNTTIIYNRLSNCTLTRTKFYCRIGSIRSATLIDSNALNRTTNRSSACCTRTTATNNSNRRLRRISSTTVVNKNTRNDTFGNDCSSRCTSTTSTNNRYKWR